MLSIRLEETKIKEITSKMGIDRKTIYMYPHEVNDAIKTLNFSHVSKDFLRNLGLSLPDDDKTRILIENYLTPPEKILEKKANSLDDVAALLNSAQGRGDILGVTAGKLVFPITIDEVSRRDDVWGGNRVTISFSFRYADVTTTGYKSIYPEALVDSAGEPLVLQDILRKAHFVPFGAELYKVHAEKVARCYRLQTESGGKTVRVKGPVYVKPFWGTLPVEIQIGAGEKKAIVEGELELREAMWYNDTDSTDEVIPLVRVFLLDRKVYCYAHIDNVTEHKYDRGGFAKVVMPDNVRTLFERIFAAGPAAQFGDIFGGRHGGTVILADGPPGTGKTLTAEAVAELSERPLYVADVGEIGVDLDTVEEKLKLVLERASKWNAVLLLDEADIFLVKRDVDNIERNAIVGTFLKFLDGFDGTLFLTTNRVQVIDPAFASRITARINYKPLDSEARFKIWQRMVAAAEIKLSDKDLKSLSEHVFNGRQIRNVVRLTKMYHGDKDLKLEDVTMLFEHILQVKETWEEPESPKSTR